MSEREKQPFVQEVGDGEKSDFVVRVNELMGHPRLTDTENPRRKWSTTYQKEEIAVRMTIPEPGHAADHFEEPHLECCEDCSQTSRIENKPICVNFMNVVTVRTSELLVHLENGHALVENQFLTLNLNTQSMGYQRFRREVDEEGLPVPSRQSKLNLDSDRDDRMTMDNFKRVMSVLNILNPEDEQRD